MRRLGVISLLPRVRRLPDLLAHCTGTPSRSDGSVWPPCVVIVCVKICSKKVQALARLRVSARRHVAVCVQEIRRTNITKVVIRGPPLGRLVSSEPESGPWRLLFPLLAFILVVRGSSVRLLRLTSSDPVSLRFNSIDPDPVTGPESVGSESVGLESVGPEGVGSESVGPDGVSPESVGPESVGSESVGPESVGSESVCSDSVIPPTIEQRKRPSPKALCRGPNGVLTNPVFDLLAVRGPPRLVSSEPESGP